MAGFGDSTALSELRERVQALAVAWGEQAQGVTTAGQERAILRMLGVTGTDREGRPLAAGVLDRFLGPDPRRLAGGIMLPFALAMDEYGRTAPELALDVAAGNVDLGLEAELLADPVHRAAAADTAAHLLRSALERVDANRVARREIASLLGDPSPPRVGVTLGSPAIVDALDEAAEAIAAGAGIIAVRVPPARELSEGLARIGGFVEPWQAAPTSRGGLDVHDPSGPPVPTGAQRALAVLRRHIDEAGARQRGYVRILTEAQPLAAPDQAVVAAFERIDEVVADPMREIVAGRVHPDRALADHVFANRLLCRAGVRVLVSAGPLIVGQDFAAGMPSDPATRAGRALVLQLLAVELAIHNGLPPGSVSVGAMPDWMVDEPAPAARTLAEVLLRRALLPEHDLAFVEPDMPPAAAATWNAITGAVLPDAGRVEMVLRRPLDGGGRSDVGAVVAATVAAAGVASGLRGSREVGALTGIAREHAERCVQAALDTLAGLEAGGPAALMDQSLGIGRPALGADAVARRDDGFDPLALDRPPSA